MTTLAIETIHGTDSLVAKGPERAELLEVLPAPGPGVMVFILGAPPATNQETLRRLGEWFRNSGGTE